MDEVRSLSFQAHSAHHDINAGHYPGTFATHPLIKLFLVDFCFVGAWEQRTCGDLFPDPFSRHTLQLLSILVQFTEPVANGENLFARLFLDKETAAEALTIFTVEEMTERILHVVDTYYNINDLTVFYYAPNLNESGVLEPVKMLVEYRPELVQDAVFSEIREFELDEDMPLGPMNTSFDDAKTFLNHSDTITLRFVLLDDVTSTQFGLAPMSWTIDVLFTNMGGIFSAEIWTVRHIRSAQFLHKLGFIPATIIAVSIISLGLGIKATYSVYGVLMRTRHAWKAVPQPMIRQAWKEVNPPGVLPVYLWSEIPLSVKLDFFSSWNTMECVGELCLIIGCVIGFILDHGLPVSDQSRLFIGAGSMILCINFIKYLEFWKKFSALVMTLQGSFLRNVRFVISVFPLYMGFLVCGYVMFSPYSPYFESISVTAVTLFALINGDDTHAIFRNLWENYPYPKISQAYLFSFDLLFITLVLNVFLYIIEDAYQAAAYWINGAGEKLSRSHRHMRADMPLPKNWIPRPGSVEFDVPTLFRILEKAQALLQGVHDAEALDPAAPGFEHSDDGSSQILLGNEDSKDSMDNFLAVDLRSRARKKKTTIQETTDDEFNELHASDDDHGHVSTKSPVERISTSLKTSGIPSTTPPVSLAIKASEQESEEDVSTPSMLQVAIENAVAQSQIAFQRQVEENMRTMQEEYSLRLQKEVAALVQRSLATQFRAASKDSK